jgi:hypothetical protein
VDVKEQETLRHVLDGHWCYRSKGLALDTMLHGLFRTVLDIGAGSGIFRSGFSRERRIRDLHRSGDQGEWRELFNGKPICFCARLPMNVLEHVDDDVGLMRSALSRCG